MICEKIAAALRDFGACSMTESGARIKTHCLYPSFEPVHIYVAGFGDGFFVHDGGDANNTVWAHGRDQRLASRMLGAAADLYSISFLDGKLGIQIESIDWLSNAIISVSNAAALGAHNAVAKISKMEEIDLRDRMEAALESFVSPKMIAKDYSYIGNSGREYHFDFAVVNKGNQLALIDGVVPHAASIYAKFTAFSDVDHEMKLRKFAIYGSRLNEQDKTLLQQVAAVVPLKSFQPGIERALIGVH